MQDSSQGVVPSPTLGESRVRTKFNVAEDKATRSNIDAIKQDTARLIDFCESGKIEVSEKDWNQSAKNEAARLWSLAQTTYEEAAMWAVKAATYGK